MLTEKGDNDSNGSGNEQTVGLLQRLAVGTQPIPGKIAEQHGCNGR